VIGYTTTGDVTRAKRLGVRARPSAEVRGSTRATAILDHDAPRIRTLAQRVESEATPLDALRAAHRIIARDVRPVYSVEDRRRVSRTLRLGRGSCSQRMAALEAVARAVRVRARVRGLLVDGAFWYPRFPRLKPFVPEEAPPAWPEFRINGAWIPIGELFTAPTTDRPYADKGGETLFDAVARTGIRWDGDTGTDTAPTCAADGPPCDLSAQVLADLGHFDDRDDLFTRHGQTLCRTARTLGEPVLGRWNAGARAASGPSR
jgi:hypothetical protein